MLDTKGIRVPSAKPNSTSSSTLTVHSFKKTHKLHPRQVSLNLTESNKPITRSSRRSDDYNYNREETNSNTQKSGNGKMEKSVLRSFFCGNASEDTEKSQNGNSTEFLDKGRLIDEQKIIIGVDLSKQFSSYQGNAGKRAKKSGNGKCSVFNDCLGRGVIPYEGNSLLSVGLSEKSMDKLGKRIACSSGASLALIVDGGVKERRDIDRGCEDIGVKRTRNQVEEGKGVNQGWTKDQELALESAYLTEKPTPQFWKQVARLVPGKSAKDCFDKVHSNHLTPPPPRPRSRARVSTSSPPSLSASKLLNSSRSKVKKQKSHIVQKTVRHMLQKQSKVDKDSEADLFSDLEPTLGPTMQPFQQHLILSTPDRNQEKPNSLNGCEGSSSAQKKNLSRFSNLCGTSLLSPPVLKQVKNKALHEKYIDLLHRREASRKAASARIAKSQQGKGVKKEIHVQQKDAIETVKIALVFDARDALNQIQHLQSNAMMISFSDEDVGAENDEDEGEVVF